MAKFCGGIKLDPKIFKIVDGVISLQSATSLDVTKAVSTCGQLWDGNIFTVRNGVITVLHRPFKTPPIPIKGSCGIGLDGCCFKLSKGVVTVIEGGLLTVNVSPVDATIKVIDVDGDKWEPIAGTTNKFMLTRPGTYQVEVSKTGYITKDESVTVGPNSMEPTIEVTLEAAG